MKQKSMTRLLSRLAGLAVAGSLFACSAGEEDPGAAVPAAAPVSIRLKTGATAAPELDFSVYIFAKPVGQDPGTGHYVFKNSLVLDRQQGQLAWEESEVRANDYRMLFLALPAGREEITIGGADASPLAAGTPWEEVRLTRASAPLSDAVYYKIEDISGSALGSTHLIETQLDRLVGRMMFDCFKVAGAVSREPVDVDPASGVASVLDRVYEIEIAYGNPVQQLAFEGTALRPLPGEASPETQTISLAEEAGLKVTLPQEAAGLLELSGAKGGVRLTGLNLLPTAAAMPVTLTFRYYDTTPVCGRGGEAGHTHTSACYAQSSLVLNLRGADGAPTTSIRSGYLTVGKGAILFNRIIDLPAASTLDVDFGWDVSNLSNYN